MDNEYLNRMREKENLCRAYMQKADAIYEFNDFTPSKEECMFLQKAALLHSEMAQMSIGEEQNYHQRQVHELNQRIKNIVRVIDPERYRKLQDSLVNSQKSASSVNAEKSGTKTNTTTEKKDPLDDTVQNWFKEAPTHSFDDVSGMAELKERLNECIVDFHLVSVKDYLEIEKVQSYFFVGPPGCGKTYIIEAFAHELMDKDYKFMSLVGSDILSRFVGEAEKIVTRCFEEAEKNAPCILFVDEVDGVCKNRSQSIPEYAASLTTAFLTGYNKISKSKEPIIFIGATNYPDKVDNAMLDRVEIIRVPLPDEDARTSAFERHLKPIIALEEGFTFNDMAKKTAVDYNYRDIDRLVSRIKNMVLKEVMQIYQDEQKAIEALKTQQYVLREEIFDKAQAECSPSPKKEIQNNIENWYNNFLKNIKE